MELLVKVGTIAPSQQSYQDGDIVCAISPIQTHYCHAECICHPTKYGFNSDGLRDRGTLFESHARLTSRWQFSRVGSSVERLELATGNVEIVSDQIDAEQFIERRIRSKRHKIFGNPGAEIWYGGNATRDRAGADLLWNEIETHSDNLKADHCCWPFSDLEKRHFLPLDCCGFQHGTEREISTGTCGERCSEVYEPEADKQEAREMIARRHWQVPYWDLAGISVDDARNKDKPYDARSNGDEEKRHLDDVSVDKVAAGIVEGV